MDPLRGLAAAEDGAARLAALDRRFKLTESGNSEIAHVWFRLAIANRYAAAYPAMERYMIRIGRRKLIVPLYRDLAATPEGLAMAKRIFAKARDGYHPLAQTAVADILNRDEDVEALGLQTRGGTRPLYDAFTNPFKLSRCLVSCSRSAADNSHDEGAPAAGARARS